MKKLLLAVVAFFFMCGMACAASNVTFEWDANSESDLAGYRLYQSQTPGVYTFGDGNQVATILVGTETVQITGVLDGTYFWVLTAYDTKGNESGPSNEVTANLDMLAPNAPATVTITIIIKVQ
ncbi:MAG: hypothetical protein ABIL62_09505 [Planctomycetota bacterium]|uniref:Putative structural protein n=1 Tax=viral metagenome TaxID=1070528 RepID=A0A6H1ZDT6_9ZZZZ